MPSHDWSKSYYPYTALLSVHVVPTSLLEELYRLFTLVGGSISQNQSLQTLDSFHRKRKGDTQESFHVSTSLNLICVPGTDDLLSTINDLRPSTIYHLARPFLFGFYQRIKQIVLAIERRITRSYQGLPEHTDLSRST